MRASYYESISSSLWFRRPRHSPCVNSTIQCVWTASVTYTQLPQEQIGKFHPPYEPYMSEGTEEIISHQIERVALQSINQQLF